MSTDGLIPERGDFTVLGPGDKTGVRTSNARNIPRRSGSRCAPNPGITTETSMKTISTRSAAALLILAAGVAGCGGASSASSAAGTGPASAAAAATPGRAAATSAASTSKIDGCALVTEQEATALLGADPGPGVQGSDAIPGCAYGGSLTVAVYPDGQGLFDSRSSTMGLAGGVVLTGVGDKGVVVFDANKAEMDILKGSTYLLVGVQQGDPTHPLTLAALTALGKTAAGRL
jgi:hypothetical protein